MYSHPNGLHFLAMPRTASKACCDALHSRGFVSDGGHHSLRNFEALVKPNHTVISTIRNHFDWFVSFWYLNGAPGKFDWFVSQFCSESQWVRRNADMTRCAIYWKYAPLSHTLMRFNHIQEDLNRELEKRDIEPVTLVQQGKPKPRPYQSYYRPGTIKFISDLFQEELTQYGFTY